MIKIPSSAGQRSATDSSIFKSSIRNTTLFFRKQLWIWPIVAAISLAIVAWSVRGIVEDAVKSTIAESLRTILEADVTALTIWLESQVSNADAIASDPELSGLVRELHGAATQPGFDPLSLNQAPALEELRLRMKPWMEAQGYNGFVVVSMESLVLAAMRDGVVGTLDLPLPEGLIDGMRAGESMVTRPFASSMLLEAEDGEKRVGQPTMFAVSPVRNESGDVIAAFGLRIRPEEDFTRILQVARAGQSGETYAFDGSGLLISMSRFDEQLKEIGLLLDREDSRSILNIQIRDPQVNMTLGKRPQIRRPQQPLTRMALAAIQGETNVDVEGYNDYRGVPVIGAWTWLENYGFGVTTEVDVTEAYRPLYILRYTFWALFGLLAAAALAIFGFTVVVARLNRAARKAAKKVEQLGQYSLQEKIGAGGMGSVYRGNHSMLRRPTAIKLLDPEKTTDHTIARFEREVQLTSQLTHPNTIAVYDFGRTPEGMFYYAMEFLDGVNLESFIWKHGPQPEGRVIHILRQVCGSLGEAHDIGLIHRDVKPSNIILNRRGGLYDVVKLLDFGLVKASDAEHDASLTVAGALTGTPHYMSPESVQNPSAVDARSDLYAVGAVGYFLLTGKHLFTGETIMEICMGHVEKTPVPPSERLGSPISEDLEQLILKCLAKNPDDRPATAVELEEELARCSSAGYWPVSSARAWWIEQDEKNSVSDATVAM